jgi:hypothetical protein
MVPIHRTNTKAMAMISREPVKSRSAGTRSRRGWHQKDGLGEPVQELGGD